MSTGTLGVIGIVLGLMTLIFLSFRGWSMLPTSLIASIVVIITNRMDLFTALTDGYGMSMKNYVGAYLLLFFLGTLFGEILGKSEGAKSIAMQLLKIPLKRKALLVVVLSSAILSYGGVSLFVIVFSIYPIALVLFKEENISKRLFPAALFLGCATFTMVSMPGTPAVQNLIPTEVFGTTAYAAPIMGIICSIFMFVLGMAWLLFNQRRLEEKGIGFIPGPRDNMDEIDITSTEGMPSFIRSITPIILILILIYILGNRIEDTIHSVNIALTIGIVVSLILFRKNLRSKVELLNEGAANSINSLLNTAVIVGFGGVVQHSIGFETIVDFALNLDMSPLISGSLATGIVSAACGSASGGLSVFMDALGPEYVALAAKTGIPLEVMHRVFVMAAAGLDSMPHSGGFITAIVATDLTHKETYPYFFVTNIVITSLGAILGIILYSLFGIV